MSRTAKLFMNGRSQAVRLPSEFRFDGEEVNIQKDSSTGGVLLTPKSKSLENFFKLLDQIPQEELDSFAVPRDRTPLKPRKVF